MQNRLVLSFCVLVWLSIALCSFIPLLGYESKAARSNAPANSWPSRTHVIRDSKANLLMFLHPQCPCSRASLNQLDKLMAASGTLLSATVFFEQPEKASEAWSKSSLWQQAYCIPGIKVILDKRQNEAQNFGAATSGEVFLYAGDGQLLFHGGITAGRGHEGDCDAYDRILSLIHSKGCVKGQESAVFGCALFDKK